MPDWARAGKIRFARWDGGRIETAKAFLSGWPGFNPPVPDFVESMTNWYTAPTIPLLREAGINTIFVTFSNGFSIQSERAHAEQLKRYIAECHRAGSYPGESGRRGITAASAARSVRELPSSG